MGIEWTLQGADTMDRGRNAAVVITFGQSSRPALALIVELDRRAEVGEYIRGTRPGRDAEIRNATSRVGIVVSMAPSRGIDNSSTNRSRFAYRFTGK